MGFPLHWLDLPSDRLEAMKTGAAERRARWWNKQGIVMTGNAQNPRVVEVLGRAMIAAEGRAVA